MAKQRSSPIYHFTREHFETHLAKSKSITDLITQLGVPHNRWTRELLRDRFQELGLDYELLACMGMKSNRTRSYTNEEIFCEGSTPSRSSLKKRFRALNLVPYQCEKCGLGPEWQGEGLVLVLDHINGVSNDNRVENLRFLCPNCNSQTDTFTGKNTTKRVKTVSSRSEEVKSRNPPPIKVPKPPLIKDIGLSIEDLHRLAWEKPLSLLAKEVGLSDNGIRKRLKKVGLNWPNQGFWLKGISPKRKTPA